MAIIDASVYVAFLRRDEPYHQATVKWMNRIAHTGEPLMAPNILLAEVSAAIRRGTGDQSLSEAVLTQLQTSTQIKFVPVTNELAIRAAEIAIDHQIRGCDAIYVALAEQVRQVLITLDQQQLHRGAMIVTTAKPG